MGGVATAKAACYAVPTNVNAYGGSSDLAGEALIFSIRIISVEWG
jgi:hypothetical protein